MAFAFKIFKLYYHTLIIYHNKLFDKILIYDSSHFHLT